MQKFSSNKIGKRKQKKQQPQNNWFSIVYG